MTAWQRPVLVKLGDSAQAQQGVSGPNSDFTQYGDPSGRYS